MSMHMPIPMPTKVLDVAKAVALFLRLDASLMIGKTRMTRVARARWIAWWIAHYKLDKSYTFIGQVFRKDHTSVIYGVKQCQSMIDAGDRQVIDVIDGVCELLRMGPDDVERHVAGLERQAEDRHRRWLARMGRWAKPNAATAA